MLDQASPGDLQVAALRLRFKPAPRSSLDDLESFSASTTTPIWRHGHDIAGGQVCVQAGVVVARWTLFESWSCLPVRDAVAWIRPE